MKIHEALIDVMRAIPAVRKEDRNTQGKGYNFRGIDAVLNAVGPVLRDKGVIVYPRLIEHRAEDVAVGRDRTTMRMVTLMVRYTFVGPEGDELTVEVPGEAMDSGDKAFAKAMSVAMRTALLQTLALPTDEKDPDAESYERTDAVRSEVEKARDELLARIEDLKLHPGQVNRAYRDQHGVVIQEEKDVDKLRVFMDGLKART